MRPIGLAIYLLETTRQAGEEDRCKSIKQERMRLSLFKFERNWRIAEQDADARIVIASSDKDLYQLASANVSLLRMISQRYSLADLLSLQHVTKANIEETFQIPVRSLALFQALRGERFCCPLPETSHA